MSVRKKGKGLLVLVVVALITPALLLFTGMGYYNNIAGVVVNKAYAQDNGLDFQVTRPTADLTRDWWQWVLSFPADENPLTDRTGEECDKGDFGDTFFLVGSLGGRVERDCTTTEGQDILIPIVNTICATITGETAEELLEQCREIIDQTRNLQLRIDRNEVFTPQNLRDNRVTVEELFTVELPEDNLFGLPAGTTIEAVADGYWAQIEGLSAGEHTLRVIGVIGGTIGHFNVDVTYHLTVEGEATDEEEAAALAIDEEVQEEQQPAEEEGGGGEEEGNGGDGDILDEGEEEELG